MDKIERLLTSWVKDPELAAGLERGRILAFWPQAAGELAELTSAVAVQHAVLLVEAQDPMAAHLLTFQKARILAAYQQAWQRQVIKDFTIRVQTNVVSSSPPPPVLKPCRVCGLPSEQDPCHFCARTLADPVVRLEARKLMKNPAYQGLEGDLRDAALYLARQEIKEQLETLSPQVALNPNLLPLWQDLLRRATALGAQD